MPYEIVTDRQEAPATPGAFLYEVRLWPHQSLTGTGFVWVIGGTFAMACIPLIGLLGTVVFLGILPFAMISVVGLTLSLKRSWRDRDIVETFRLTADRAELIRIEPDGSRRDWEANPYWVRVSHHDRVGQVEHYLTLDGGPRRVEIGSFLTPAERRGLESRLSGALARLR